MKMVSRGNGQKNPSPISLNTETGSLEYGNGRNKIENGTGQNGIFFPSVFNLKDKVEVEVEPKE